MLQASTPSPGKASRLASLALSLCLPANSLLYLVLPLYSTDFGITIAQAGVLLAANRLVRILGYSHVVRFYARHGDRTVCTVAVAIAAACAVGYATLTGFVCLLIVRMAWGVAFAALNVSTQALSTVDAGRAAQRTGTSRAIIAMGSAVTLPLMAILAYGSGPRVPFYLLAFIALMGLLAARALPHRGPSGRIRKRRCRAPDGVAILSFVEGVVLDGLFIFGLSLHAQAVWPDTAILVASVILTIRYLSELALSPLGGSLAQRWGAEQMLVAFSLLTSAALIIFGLNCFLLGGAMVMVLRAMQSPLLAPVVALRHGGRDRLPALAANAVWRDIGAAVGPLLAGVLLPVTPALCFYVGASAALALSAILVGVRRVRSTA